MWLHLSGLLRVVALPSFTGRRNALTSTSASTPTLSGTTQHWYLQVPKTVERWVDPPGLHFTKRWYYVSLVLLSYG